MYKWIAKTVLALILAAAPICCASSRPAAAAETEVSWIDTSSLKQATIGIRCSGSPTKRHKVMIVKADKVYTYDLQVAGQSQTFPLQSGNGAYEVTMLEQASGTQYQKIGSTSVNLQAASDNAVFLGSVQNVNWKDSKTAAALAKKLTAGKKTDTAKAKAIHEYVTAHIGYDFKKAKSLGSLYLPSADQTLSSQKGICYDYASLMGVMLRSSGIPTKLVMGSTTYVKEYHAWNEIYLNGRWVIVDATIDAAYKQAGKEIPFAKSADKYSTSKVY
jgi:transglutaminase-like putative cysteine protease